MPYTSADQPLPQRLPKFYRCGICDYYHSIGWNGDCREAMIRFECDELDTLHGRFGWEEVPMPGGEENA